jgi:hypothetical protein
MTTPVRGKRRLTLLACILGALGASTAGRAAPAAGGASPVAPARSTPTAQTRTKPIVIVLVHAPPGSLDRAALRKAIAKDLGVQAVAPGDPRAATARGAITVSLKPDDHELAVSYAEENGSSVSRIVVAPGDRAEATHLAALLATNLARHQARDLLAGSADELGNDGQSSETVSPAIAETESTSLESASPDIAASPPPVRRFATASLFYPVASNASEPDVQTSLHLNLVYGRIGTLDGFALGTVTANSGRVEGSRIALGANLVGGDVSGVDIAVGGNLGKSSLYGVGIAAGFNLMGADLAGVQIAGGFNYLHGRARGVQVAGGANVALDGLDGGQISAVNVAGDTTGAQLGAVNVARDTDGGQISAANVARDVNGVQIGAVNVGRNVNGVQLGVVNVANDVDGIPIGLVSVTKSGGVHPMVWASSLSVANVGVKFATRYTYTIISGSYDRSDGQNFLGPGFAIGGRIPLPLAFSIDTDLQAMQLFGEPFDANRPSRADDRTFFKWRAALSFEIFKHLSVFGGGSVAAKFTFPNDTMTYKGIIGEGFGGVQF